MNVNSFVVRYKTYTGSLPFPLMRWSVQLLEYYRLHLHVWLCKRDKVELFTTLFHKSESTAYI